MNLNFDSSDIESLSGFGHNKVVTLGSIIVPLEIDSIVEEVKIFVIPDGYISEPVLVGRSFTEKEGIIAVKDEKSLTFYKREDGLDKISVDPEVKKIALRCLERKIIPPNSVGHIPVSAENFVGDLYLEASLRAKENQEHCLPRLVLSVNKDDPVAVVPIFNFSDNEIVFKPSKVVARGWPCVLEDSPEINSQLSVLNIENLPPLNFDSVTVGPVTSKAREALFILLTLFRDCFAESTAELGNSKSCKIAIRLTDDKPFSYRPYRLSLSEQEEVRKIIEDLLANDIITESTSDYSSPILLVKKKNGELRMCIDYRKLNSLTVKDNHPLPRIDDQIDRLRGGVYFTSLDLKSGYYQVEVEESSRKYTAFVTSFGEYEYKKMPFGLTNAPRTFQRLMNRVLKPVSDLAAVYLDDILLHSKTEEEALEALEKVLVLLRQEGLTLNLQKCAFLMTKVTFLGFEVEAGLVRPGDHKIKAVTDFPVPQSIHNVRQFVGLTSYFRQFVPNYACIAKPLTSLLKKSNSWCWSEAEEAAFKKLKEILVCRPVLALYDPNSYTEVHTDASAIGLGGVLFQRQADEKLHPVAYYSRQTSSTESKYHSYELETLAVVETLKKFRSYLVGIQFTVVTDCNSLKASKEKKELVPRIARWWLQMQEYTFDIVYRPGDRMKHVDALSRNPVVFRIEQDDWVLSGQLTDHKIKTIREILTRGIRNSLEKQLVKDYILRGGRVYRKTSKGEQWVVPRAMRREVVRAAHDDFGHFGAEKTLQRLCSTYWFPSMRQYVEKYIACCVRCLFNKRPAGRKEGFLHPIPKGTVPLKTIHVDHLGPFPRSSRGNEYVIVIVDAFTKFVFLKAVKSTKIKFVLDFFQELFMVYGIPEILISDQATCFSSKNMKIFCDQYNIHHTMIAVATPRANGQVERLNRSVLAALSTSTLEEENWDDNVGKVQFAMNNLVNKSTGKTPSELMFGYSPRGGTDILLRDEVETVSSVLLDLHAVREEAAKLNQVAQNRYKVHFDKKRKPAKVYKIGDLVLVEKQVQATGGSKKLSAPFSGPMIVRETLPNDRFKVSSIGSGRRYERVVAIDKIRPWVEPDSSDEESDSSTA